MTIRSLVRPLAIVPIMAALLAPAVVSAQPARPSAPAPSPRAATAVPTTPPAPAATAPVRDAGYQIGADDVIEIDLLGQADFKTRGKVRSDGTIQLPLLGAVTVTGRTPVTLADEIAAKLRAGGFYAKPIVSVEIVSYASRYVIVLGEVGSPGLLPVDRVYRVSEVIARSGGIRESGSDTVILRRADGTEARLPFEKLASGGAADDPFVAPGDKVYVPAAEMFYIYGQVGAPGAYPLKAGLTLRRAIARGGGLGQAGSEKRIKLYHNGVEQKVQMDQVLQPGDVVVVGERLF